MNIPERIDELLKERNLSRRQAAIKAGIPPSSLQSAMQRNGSMTVEMLEKLSAALECSISDIITPNQEPQQTTDKNRLSPKDKEYLSAFMDDGLSERARAVVCHVANGHSSQKEFKESISFFKFGYLAAQGVYPENTDILSDIDFSPDVIRFVKKLISLSPEDRDDVLREIVMIESPKKPEE